MNTRRQATLGLFGTLWLATVGTPGATAQDIDSDADGIADTVDNCVLVANPEQRDTDTDGYGNRCDADFNNDLIVNIEDLGELRRAFFGTSVEHDLNADGIVNVADLGLFRTYFFLPPGPGAPDVDGDGVTLAQDLCPNTPPEVAAISDGCSAFDIAQRPDRVLDVRAASAQALTLLQGNELLLPTRDSVEAVVETIEQSFVTMKGGQPCEAMSSYTLARDDLVQASNLLESRIVAFERTVSSDRPFNVTDCTANPTPECEAGADHTAADDQALVFRIAHASVEALVGQINQRGGALEQACSGITGTLFNTGHVMAVDDRNRRIDLYNDDVDLAFTVALAEGANVLGDLYPGRDVRVTGNTYGSTAATAINVVPVDLPMPPFALAYDDCAVLRIAPYQRFGQFRNGPLDLHDPAAYDYDGRLRVEIGMAFATVQTYFGCPDSNPDYRVRYSQTLTLTFDHRITGEQETLILAPTLTHESEPVPIPPEVDHASTAMLTVEFKRQTCPIGPPGTIFTLPCSEQDVYKVEHYELSVWDRGTFCQVDFAEDEFELEYTDPTVFRSTTISGFQSLLAEPDPGTSMTVLAEGYSVAGSASSFPAINLITTAQPFALYRHDCVTDPSTVFTQDVCGTAKASGLRWPRLVGQRNNRSFAYHCRLPDVTRDLRDYCPGNTNALHKLPFRGSGPVWQISQGNNESFTHNGPGAFAFDFVAAEGEIIRASRRGLVILARDDQTGNSYYDPDCTNCMANNVTLVHEDNTTSEYLHLQPGGALVSVGQFVERGDAVGLVGNTGYSTGPHLHFQSRALGNSSTRPVLFEALVSGPPNPPWSCWAPVRGDYLASDN